MKIQRLRRKYRRKYGHPDPALLKSWNCHMQPPKIVPLVMPYLQGEARRKAKQMGFFERLEAEKQNDLINFVKAQDEKERIEGRTTLSDSIRAAIVDKIIAGDCHITGSVTDHDKKKMWVEFTFYKEADA